MSALNTNHNQFRREYHEAYSDFAMKRDQLNLLRLICGLDGQQGDEIRSVIDRQTDALDVARTRYLAAKQAFVNHVFEKDDEHKNEPGRARYIQPQPCQDEHNSTAVCLPRMTVGLAAAGESSVASDPPPPAWSALIHLWAADTARSLCGLSRTPFIASARVAGGLSAEMICHTCLKAASNRAELIFQ